MQTLSKDSRINEMCNAMLNSGRWRLSRHSKHPILQHLTSTKFFIIPGTPSDSRAFANFRKEYNRFLRKYLIHIRWIQ